MASAHMERTSSYSVLTTSASETSAWLSVCVFVRARVFVGVYECYCLRFPERLLEQNGQIPGILSFFLAQGKVRHVSIHRHKSTRGQLAENRKEKWTNDMHSTVNLIRGQGRGTRRWKTGQYAWVKQGNICLWIRLSVHCGARSLLFHC